MDPAASRWSLGIGPFRIRIDRPAGAPAPAHFNRNPHRHFLLPPGESDGDAAYDAVVDFSVAPLPAPPPGPTLFRHRAQWCLRRAPQRTGWVAPLLAPPPAPRLRRMAWLDEAFHTVRLQTEPAERWSDDPLACLFSEFLVLGLLARGGGVLAHAAALGRGGRTLLALGPSGAGKSTLAAIAAEAGWEVLGDESHILAETGAAEGVRVYGTPWPGTGGLFRNASAPLAGILLLAHGEANRLDPLGGAEGAAHLLSHFFLPAWSGAALERTAAFAGRLAQRIPIHRYAFRPDTSALGPLDALL